MKKGGIFKNIKALIVFIVLSALFLAALSQFNWDVFEMITWCLNKIWEAITRLTDYFANLPFFRSIFGR